MASRCRAAGQLGAAPAVSTRGIILAGAPGSSAVVQQDVQLFNPTGAPLTFFSIPGGIWHQRRRHRCVSVRAPGFGALWLSWVMECAGTRERTSWNHANGSTPHRLQEAMKLRSTAAVLPPLSLPKKTVVIRPSVGAPSAAHTHRSI